MTPEYLKYLKIDAEGRNSSGRSLRRLADEYTDFVAALRNEWGADAPLPYEEFAGPYRELRHTLLDACDRLGGNLRHAGHGQITMAENNIETEHINTTNITSAGQPRT